MRDYRDRGLRGVLGGLLALLLVGGTVVASAVIAFAEMGASRPATASPTASATLPPATPLPTQAPPTPTATRRPPTASPLPSASATQAPTDTAPPPVTETETSLPPSETATAEPPPTATPVPTQAATACVPAPPAGWAIYVIQPGDTLSNLALRFGVSQAALQRANCIADPSDIRSGGRIYAPAASTQPPLATVPPAISPTVPSNIPTITSIPIPTATPACVPPEFFDPLLNRCRLPDS